MTNLRADSVVVSVRHRLLDLSRERHEDYNLILTRYAIERLLYRLTQSGHAHEFVLKGAMLFSLWTEELHRPTRDLDLLGYGDPSGERLLQLFKDVCVAGVQPDGLAFDAQSVRVTEIRERQEYSGQRVRLAARLGKARIAVQIDIGFGDAVTPEPLEVEYPTLLAFPAPRLCAYPKETVVAEKMEAMVVLGIINSRMRDFFDVWTMCQVFPFDGRILSQAMRATFERRRTPVPGAEPVALSAEFGHHGDKNTQWNAFLSRNRLDVGEASFANIIHDLNCFLLPPLSAIADRTIFDEMWPAKGPWVPRSDSYSARSPGLEESA